MAELSCEQVAKSFGRRVVLSEVDLQVPEGTLTAILGASGSGKTTLLRSIMGFVGVDRGRIAVGGTVVAAAGYIHMAPEKRAIGYVAQEGALYPHLRVGENVGFGLPRSERKAGRRIGEVLDLVGLNGDYAGRRPHELSGGEQRRVALARALAPRPRLVLLDEPFSGLDASLRVETRRAVLDALAAARTTGVLVTHDQAEALSLGREVAVLREGRLVQTDAPAALYTSPADLDVALFVGDAVVLRGHATSGTVHCILGSLRTLHCCPDGPVEAVIRPEQIELRSRTVSQSGMQGGPCRSATVTHLTYYGSETIVRLTVDDADETVVTAKVFSHEAPRVGEPVELLVSGPVVAYPTTPTTGSSAGVGSYKVAEAFDPVGAVQRRPEDGSP